MAQADSHCRHDRHQEVAFPGHEGKQTLFSFHGQYATQIFIDDPQKSKMVNHQRQGQAHAGEYQRAGELYRPQPRVGQRQQHGADTDPHATGQEYQYVFIDGGFDGDLLFDNGNPSTISIPEAK